VCLIVERVQVGEHLVTHACQGTNASDVCCSPC
jgi:hypothetical protein